MQPGMRHTVATIMHYLPTSIVNYLLQFNKELPAEAKYAVSDTIYYYNVMNMLNMGYIEAQTVLDIDEDIKDVIQLHMERMTYLYGPKDNYAPKEFHDHLKSLFPNAKTYLADESIAHAFVLKHSEAVVNQLLNWIKLSYLVYWSFTSSFNSCSINEAIS